MIFLKKRKLHNREVEIPRERGYVSSRYSLRNNDTIFLERPKGVMRTTLGARSFHVSAPARWNSLPAHIRTIESLALFKKSLNTYFLSYRFRFALQSYRYLVFFLLTFYSFIHDLFIIIILF